MEDDELMIGEDGCLGCIFNTRFENTKDYIEGITASHGRIKFLIIETGFTDRILSNKPLKKEAVDAMFPGLDVACIRPPLDNEQVTNYVAPGCEDIDRLAEKSGYGEVVFHNLDLIDYPKAFAALGRLNFCGRCDLEDGTCFASYLKKDGDSEYMYSLMGIK